MQAAWETLGLRLKLEPSSTFRSLEVPYEGGMRVVSVRPNSSAEREGVLEGDILVRMHRWATKSEDDIRFIVDHADQLARSGKVKFYIVRGDSTYFGDLLVAGRNSNAVR
jgi:serine protease Do